MKLIQFKGGTGDGYDVWICPDSIVSISQTNQEGIVNVNTLDGKTTAVSGTVGAISQFLIQQPQ